MLAELLLLVSVWTQETHQFVSIDTSSSLNYMSMFLILMISWELVCHFLIVHLVAVAANSSKYVTWDAPTWLSHAFYHTISDRRQQEEEEKEV